MKSARRQAAKSTNDRTGAPAAHRPLLEAHEFFRGGPANAEGWGQLVAGDRDRESFYRARRQHPTVVRSTHGVNCTGSCSRNVYVKDGLICMVGFGNLGFRRTKIRRIRMTTSLADVFVLVLLGILIVLGNIETFGYAVFGERYNHRLTVGPRPHSIWVDPQPSLMSDTPIVYQLHPAIPWLLYAVWPFSRLVDVRSHPLQHLWRPYILYQSRHEARRCRPGAAT